jgi:hypothetical protein
MTSGVGLMVHAAVCLEKELLIEGASVDEVTGFCNEALKGMKLRIKTEESTGDGKTTIFASEGALVPLVLKTLLSPFNMSEYIKQAQRIGMHILVSPSKDGVHVYSCGIALSGITGKQVSYTKDEAVEEITDAAEAWDFENKFIKKILEHFPKAKQIG